MKSINKLTKEVKDAGDEVARILVDSKRDPIIVALNREIENLTRQRDESLEVIRAGMGLKAARQKVSDLAKARNLARLGNPPPTEVARIIALLTSGTTSKLKAMAWSDDIKRMILHEPGHNYPSGRGTEYAKSEWYLVDLSEVEKCPKTWSLTWSLLLGSHPLKVDKVTGRLPVKRRELWDSFLAGPEAGGITAEEVKKHKS
jgi:hypothetical protein